MMNNLLDTTSMDMNEPFEIALQKFCQNPLSTPTICPSFTLLIAISYVERLNKVKFYYKLEIEFPKLTHPLLQIKKNSVIVI